MEKDNNIEEIKKTGIPICVESIISDLDNKDSVLETKVFSDALIRHRNGKTFISYRDYDLDDGRAQTRHLSYDPETQAVSVITTGGSKFIVKEGFLHRSDYITEAGSFDIKVEGKTVVWDEKNLKVDLEYDTVLSGAVRSNIKVKLRKAQNSAPAV